MSASDSFDTANRHEPTIMVHLIADGSGDSALALLKAMRFQFDTHIGIKVWPNVNSVEVLQKTMEEIEGFSVPLGGIASCLVGRESKAQLNLLESYCSHRNISHLNCADSPLSFLSEVAGGEVPKQIHGFMDAVRYAQEHDDGQNPQTYNEAAVIIVAPSRHGKTPLCTYLASHFGVRAGNYPLVPGIEVPSELLSAKKPLIVALVADPSLIERYRKERSAKDKFGSVAADAYTDLNQIARERLHTEELARHNRWPLIDTSGKPLETIADEIVRKLRIHRRQKGLIPLQIHLTRE